MPPTGMDWKSFGRRAATALLWIGVLGASLLTAIGLALALARPAVVHLLLSAIVGSFLWTTIAVLAAATLLWALVSWWARRQGATTLFRLTATMAVVASASAVGTFAH